MIPAHRHEGGARRLRVLVDDVARRVIAETGRTIAYKVGTMIEIPRARCARRKSPRTRTSSPSGPTT
jgi:phosphoenolpyruvate synthase/pyruvate phosphate dikinase